MSNAAFNRAIEGMDSLYNEIKDVLHDIGPNSKATGTNTTGQETCRQCDSDDDVCGNRDGTQAVEKGTLDERENRESSVQNTIGAHNETRISMDRPPRAKTKGRSKTSSEKNEVTLGAQGEKKGNRKCSVCRMYSTHNAVTCPTLQNNKDCLEAMKNKKRGRPAGAKNKQNKYVQGNDREMQEERLMERKRRLLEDHSYTKIHSSSEDEDEYVDDENVD